MDFFTKLGQQFRQLWQGLSRAQKALAIGTTAALVVLLVGVGLWSSQADFQVLAVNLSPDRAAEIVNKLQDKGVPFKLAGNGTAILVPADQVDTLRLTIAAEETPSRSGLGGLDPSSLGWGPAAQHAALTHRREAELARTIMQIDPVVSARVHISQSEPSAFQRDRKPTTASVIVKLRAGAALDRKASAAIIALVSRGVEGLSRENVTLVDATGKQLSDPLDEPGALGARMDRQRDFEQHLAHKAETMLAQVLGPGHAVVRVTADLNLKTMREKKELFSPDNRIAISESTSSTRSSPSAATKGGPAGTASNLGKGAPTASSGGSENREETSKTEYIVPKTLQEIENTAGTVERLTVAVFVDLTRPADSGSTGDEKALSLADVEEAVKRVVGFKADRGDEIKAVQVRMPESNPTPSGADDDWAQQQQWQKTLSLVRNASLGVTGLAVVALGWIFLRGRKQPSPALAATPANDDAVNQERIALAFQRDPASVQRMLAGWLEESEPPARKAA